MALAWLTDRDAIRAHLRRSADLRLYELGDLDEAFWPRTRWPALVEGPGSRSADGEVRELALVYEFPGRPTLLALTRDPDAGLALLQAARDALPDRLYAHLSPGLEAALAGRYRLEPHGAHFKLVLRNPEAVRAVEASRAELLGPADAPALQRLYAEAYPANWFDPGTLADGRYAGVREGGELVAVAGVHVRSLQERVAALGNVATRPDHRGRGLATLACARLCQALLGEVDLLGLNAAQDNAPALALYRRLGFEPVGEYLEFALEAR